MSGWIITISSASTDFCSNLTNKDSGAGAIYLKLRDHSYWVFLVHPSAEVLHGDEYYPNLIAILGGVDAVFIMNSLDITEQIVNEAVQLNLEPIRKSNGCCSSPFSPAPVVRRVWEKGRG